VEIRHHDRTDQLLLGIRLGKPCDTYGKDWGIPMEIGYTDRMLPGIRLGKPHVGYGKE
jgi:hypothetical protein